MPAGQVIGRVSIKVLPDTDDFRREAQRDLDRIEKQLRIEVPTKIDMSGASRELLEEIRRINQRNRAMDSRKIRIYTTISRDGMREELSKAIRAYQSRALNERVKIKTELSVADFQAELDQQSLDNVQREIDRFKRKNHPIKLRVEADWATVKGLEVDAHLAVLTRPRTVSIIPTLNNGAYASVATALAALSGARVLNDLLDGLWNRLIRLDKAVPVIGSIAEASLGLAGYFLAAASNLAALSFSLAQIGPAALLLPGILGGVAIGVGTMVAAFKDFNTIFPDVQGKLSQLQNLISSNFWDQAEAPFRRMIDDLFPRLQSGLGQVSTQLGGFFGNLANSLTNILGPELDEMFSGLSESIDIFAGHTNSLVGIITTLGNVGASRLPQLAGFVGNLADRFDAFLSAAEADGRLQQWIDTALQNMKDLGRATGDFFGILSGIGRAAIAAGGSSLGIFADTMERVHDIVDSPAFQTGLTDLFRSAHQAMSLVAERSGPAVKDLLVTISGFLTEILPMVGSTIGVLFRGIAEGLNQAPVIDGLRSMFEGLYNAVVNLEPAFKPLGLALGAVASLIGTLARVIAPVITAALIPLSNAFVSLTPYVEEIARLLGDALLQVLQVLGPVIEQIVPILGAALADAIRQLMPIIPVVAQGIADILTAVVPLIPQILALIPPIVQLAVAVLPPLIAAFVRIVQVLVPVISAILSLINLIMPVLVPALSFLAKIIIDTVMFAVESVVLVFKGLENILSGLIDFITGIFTGNWSGAWNGIKQILVGVFQLIAGIIGTFLSVTVIGTFSKGLIALRSLWKSGLDAVTAIGKATFADIVSALKGFLVTLVESPRLAITALKAVFKTGWDAIVLAVKGAMDLLKKAVKEGVDGAVKLVKELPALALGALAGIGTTLVNAGKELIGGFISGITSKISGVKDTLGGLTKSLTDWKGPESLDRVLLTDAGRLIMDGFVRGLESRYDVVRRSLQGLTSDIAGTHINAPEMGSLTGKLALAVNGSMAEPGERSGGDKHLHYYAAEGSSIDSEEDLFEAANRARMVGW